MTIPDDDEDAGGAEDAAGSPPDFDPLLSPWEASPAPAAAFAFEDGDELASSAWHAYDLPLKELAGGDEPWWEAPGSGGPYSPQRQPSWYPEPHHQPYGEQSPGGQSQLRAGTIALPRPERRWLVTFREVAETLLLAALIFLAVRASFQNFKVDGHSMDPSLADGEFLIVNKLTYAEIDLGMFDFLPFFDAGDNPVHYLWGSPDRGDIIVFRAPTSPDRDFIKRIIGLPGDTVEINQTSGEVRVNGAPLTEHYIQGSTQCAQSCTWTVPKANSAESRQTCGSNSCYFVLGDNRQNSSDSRQGWLVPKENIVGKALITYWHEGSPELQFAPNHSVGIVGEASAEQ